MDATATGSDEIARAMSKISGTSGVANVSLEKMGSWLAVISSKTRESAETIGFSMQSILSRYMSIKERGFNEDDATKINEVTKALSSIGIQATDAKGQLRDFSEIMDLLGERYDSLSRNQKAYITTTLAGTRQGSRLSVLLQDYSQSLKLYEASLNSTGGTQRKFSIYQESLVAHLDTLSNTQQNIFKKLFNSKDLIQIVDLLNSLATGVDSTIGKIGMMPTILGTVTLALSLFKKELSMIQVSANASGGLNFAGRLPNMFNNFRQSIASFSAEWSRLNTQSMYTNGTFSQMPSTLTRITNGFRALTTSVTSSRIATVALNATLNMFIGVAIGIAITKIISSIDNWIHRVERLKQVNNDLIQSVQSNLQSNNENIQQLTSISSEYDRLRTATNLTTEEKKRLHEIQNQIGQQIPELVQGYDSEGNSIIDNTKSMSNYITVLKEKNRLENQKIMDNGSNIFKDYENQVKEVQNKLNSINQQIKENQNGYTMGTDGVGYDVKGIKQLQAELDAISDKASPQAKSLANQIETLANKNKELESSAKSLQTQIKDSTQGMKGLATAIASNSGLSDNTKNMFNNIVGNMDISNIKSLDEFKNKIHAIIETLNSTDMQKQITALNQLNMDKANISTAEFQKRLLEILTAMSKLSNGQLSVDDIAKIFNMATDSANDASNQVKSFTDIEKELVNTMEEASGIIKQVNSVLDDHAKSGEWNRDALLSLAKEYPDLLELFGDEEALEKRLIEIKKEKADTAKSSVQKQISAEIENVNTLAKAYGVDVINFNGSEQAKTEALKDAIRKRIALRASENASYARSLLGGGQSDAGMRNAIADNYDATREGNNLSKLASDLNSVDSSLKNYYKLKGLENSSSKFLSGVGSDSSDGKKDKSSSDSSTIFNASPLNRYDSAIQTINNSLTTTDNKISTISQKIQNLQSLESKSNYAEIINEENEKLNVQQQKLTELASSKTQAQSIQNTIKNQFYSNWSSLKGSNLATLTESDWTNLYNKMYGKDINFGTGDSAKVKEQKYQDGAKLFQDLQKSYQSASELVKKLGDDELKLQQDINSTIKERIDTQTSGYDELLSKQQDIIDDVQYEIDLNSNNENGTANKLALTQRLRDANQEYLRQATQIRDNLVKQQLTFKQGSVEWNLINDAVDKYDEKIKDSTKSLSQQNSEIKANVEELSNSVSSLYDQILSAIKEKYEKEKDNLLTQLETNQKNDILIKQYNSKITALRDELDRLKDETADEKKTLEAEKSELALWKEDNSVYAKSKVQELEKSIAEREKNLKIKEKEKELEDTEDKLKTQEQYYSDQKDAIEQQYKDILENEESLNAEALRIMQSGQNEIINLLKTYDYKYKNLGTLLGDSFTNSFITEINKAKQALIELQNMQQQAQLNAIYAQALGFGNNMGAYYNANPSAGYSGGSSSSSGSSNPLAGTSREPGISPQEQAIREALGFDTGGYTGEFDGGKWALLHEKEIVLNKQDTGNLLDTIRISSSLIDQIKNISLPNIVSRLSLNLPNLSDLKGTQGNTYNSPLVQNDIQIVNKTPFDVENNTQNMNHAILKELGLVGVNVGAMR